MATRTDPIQAIVAGIDAELKELEGAEEEIRSLNARLAELADADVQAERLRKARADLLGEKTPRLSAPQKEEAILKALDGSDGMTASEIASAAEIDYSRLFQTIKDMTKEKKLREKEKRFSIAG